MSIRIIAPKTEQNARRLYRIFKAYGQFPVAHDGAIIFFVNDAVEDEDTYALTIQMAKQ